MTSPCVIFLLAALLPLAACAPQQTNDADNGYRVVRMDITYAPADKRDREWRALMVAMDRCHQGGFTDAQPAHQPETRCLESGPDGCTRFAAHLAWDCIGMGYQQN
ncbi:MAG TPA: YecR family lipoprotein [Rhizomicrobium sp.]|nr:YecR family lipoprotein [Rhizomicrobium sp.]